MSEIENIDNDELLNEINESKLDLKIVLKQLAKLQENNKDEDLEDEEDRYFEGYNFNEKEKLFVIHWLKNPNLTNKEMANKIGRSEIQASRIRNDEEVKRFIKNFHRRIVDRVDSIRNKGFIILDELGDRCISTARGGKGGINNDRFKLEYAKYVTQFDKIDFNSEKEEEELPPSSEESPEQTDAIEEVNPTE